MALPELYTREETRLYLGVGKTKMQEIVSSGKLVKLRNNKYTEQAIMDYLTLDMDETTN